MGGQREGLTRDDVLDNITLTWLTNTAISGARIYWENKIPFFTPQSVSVPVAVSAFPDELPKGASPIFFGGPHHLTLGDTLVRRQVAARAVWPNAS